MNRCLIVGGGIIGTMHAWFARKNGFVVTHIERSRIPDEASVRNFGLIWISGRRKGFELKLALRARELWEEIGREAPQTGFRPHGSLTIARNVAEDGVLRSAAQMDDSNLRGFTYVAKEELERLEPHLSKELHGALKCRSDAIVEPHSILEALRIQLLKSEGYEWFPNTDVKDVRIQGDDCELITTDGRRFINNHVVLAPGAAHRGAFGQFFDGEKIRRVRLQMAAIDGRGISLRHSIADGDSLRYYPAFENCGLSSLPPQNPIAEKFKMQLLLAQRLDGTLTIGDTHEYEEPFARDLQDEPYEYLNDLIRSIFNIEVVYLRKWDGIYSQVTDDKIYFRRILAPRVHIVSGAGGRGNTLSPAIAEETFQQWQEVA